MNMHVFGLLHLAETEKTAMNLSYRDFLDQISVYVRNAVALSKSLTLVGVKYSLITNNRVAIQESLSGLQTAVENFEIKEIPFFTEVPSGVRFYSAHFKLDAFRYMAGLSEGYYALCDLDMSCINLPPVSMRNIVKEKIPMFYDITDQVIPAYGYEAIVQDLSKIAELDSEGRWSGGEFISGSPQFFSDLANEIDEIYHNYVLNISSLHHVGDEAYTSAALERLRRKGQYIADAGTLGIVGRYWNTNVLHQQRSFDYFKDLFMLHLPADKRFLSDLAERDMDSISEINAYYNKHQGSALSKTRRMISTTRNFLLNR